MPDEGWWSCCADEGGGPAVPDDGWWSRCASSGSRPEPAEGGGPSVQLLPAEHVGVAARGAEEDGHHLLARLPAGPALRRELLLLPVLPVLLPVWGPVCLRAQQDLQEVLRGTAA